MPWDQAELMETRWEFLKQTNGTVGSTLTGSQSKALQKISLYPYPLFGGWQECLGLLEREYVGGGSMAAELHVGMLTRGKHTSLPRAEKREWRLLVPRWHWHQVLGMFSTLGWGKTPASLEAQVNRGLYSFIFIEQRITLILVSLSVEGQRQERNVGSH